MSSLKIHIGKNATLTAAGERFVSAWRRAAAGEAIHEGHLSLGTLQDAAALLTRPRLELLRTLHRSPAVDAEALADALGRDCEAVSCDVDAVLGAGAIERDGRKMLRIGYDGITLELTITFDR